MRRNHLDSRQLLQNRSHSARIGKRKFGVAGMNQCKHIVVTNCFPHGQRLLVVNQKLLKIRVQLNSAQPRSLYSFQFRVNVLKIRMHAAKANKFFVL